MSGTQLRPRPAPVAADPGPADSRPPLPWLPAGRLAVRTAALGLLAVEVVILVLWFAEPHSGAGAGGALRTGVAFWLAAHHTGLRVGAGQVGVVPYGLTLLPALSLWRGGRRAGAGEDRSGVLRWTATVAPLYGLLTGLLCLAARGGDVQPRVVQALAGGTVLAALAAGGGAWRASRWRPRLPGPLLAAGAGGLLAVLVVLAAGAFLAAGAVGVAHRPVTATLRAVAPTGAGTAGLALLDLLAAPLAVLDSAAVLLGPGFGLGAGNHIGLAGVRVGPIPGLPLLAAVPPAGPLPGWALLLLAIPVLAGIAAGVRAIRGEHRLRARVLRCAGAGAFAGLLAGGLAWLADGPAGPGRLAVTGPSPWRCALAALLAVGAGALATALVRAGWDRWRRPAT